MSIHFDNIEQSDCSKDNKSESSYKSCPSCPKIYEEIIQQLESDIRKHIRIEHQLKLHIETVEDRVEELERELAKIENKSPFLNLPNDLNNDRDYKSLESLKNEIKDLKEN